MRFLSRNATAVVLGTLVLVGGSYVGAKALTAPQQVTLDATGVSAPDDASAPEVAAADATGAPDEAGAPAAAGPRGERGPIRGEAVIARKGQFPTVRFNRGVLESVDGTTLVIKEADSTTVRVDTDDKTRFRRDKSKASLSDLQPGDHVGTFEVKDGDTYHTKFVRAFSSEKWQEHETAKEQRRLDGAKRRS